MKNLTEKQIEELELSNKRKLELGVKDEVPKYWDYGYKMDRLLHDVLNWKELTKDEIAQEIFLEYFI